jgi:hypothetical protein
MKFTFGIVTSGGPELHLLVESICSQEHIKEFEIIVVGGGKLNLDWTYNNYNPIHIPFDETVKPGWISKKKNLITQHAKYENIVFMHDYFSLDKDWSYGYTLFGNDWDISMNMIINGDGYRFRDWCIYSDPKYCYPKEGPYTHQAFVVPYSYGQKEYMYISGGFWVAKKRIMEEYPINEDLCWGQGEDVEWSERVLKKCSYKMNPLSIVRMLKTKPLELTYLNL